LSKSAVTFIALLTGFFLVSGAYAVLDYTTALVWLGMDPGGRPSGMGKAFVGVADDSNATYYNPGGLCFAVKKQVSFMHEPRSITGGASDMYYDFGSFIFPTKKYGTFGIGFLYHEMGKSEETDDQGNVIGTIHSYGFAPWISYGYKVLDRLGVGGNLRVSKEHLADTVGGSVTAFSFDLGLLYKVPFPFGKLSAGLSFLNLGPNIRHDEPLPRRLQIGLGYKIMEDPMNDLLLAMDISKELVALDDGLAMELRQTVQKIGVEYFYRDIVGFRLGYYRDAYGEISGATLGFGVRYFGFEFDYARIPEGRAYGSENRFSLAYVF
jgi:hypothetical protein